MGETIESLRERMEAAARNLDFEEAKRLRDRIALMRGGATTDEAAAAESPSRHAPSFDRRRALVTRFAVSCLPRERMPHWRA